jgi:hypothetical protein
MFGFDTSLPVFPDPRVATTLGPDHFSLVVDRYETNGLGVAFKDLLVIFIGRSFN